MPELRGDVAQSLARDNATAIAFQPGSTGQTRYITGFCADYSAAVSAIKAITLKKGGTASTGPLTTSTLAIGSTDTDVATTAFTYAIRGVSYAKAAVTTGTPLAAGTIPADTWGIYLLSINAAGTIAVTAGAANFTTGYASEALAIAALPETPADSASVGYLTVLTAVGDPFIGGTDALQGGASGNPSSDTNYTSTAAIIPTTTLVAFRFDFTAGNGPCQFFFPSPIPSEKGVGVSAELEASGAGGTTGRVTLFTRTD